jgi:hypothetical protein
MNNQMLTVIWMSAARQVPMVPQAPSPTVPMVPQAPSPTVPMVPQAPTFGAQVPAFDYLTAVARTADTITYKTNGEKFVFFLNSNNFIF